MGIATKAGVPWPAQRFPHRRWRLSCFFPGVHIRRQMPCRFYTWKGDSRRNRRKAIVIVRTQQPISSKSVICNVGAVLPIEILLQRPFHSLFNLRPRAVQALAGTQRLMAFLNEVDHSSGIITPLVCPFMLSINLSCPMASQSYTHSCSASTTLIAPNSLALR